MFGPRILLLGLLMLPLAAHGRAGPDLARLIAELGNGSPQQARTARQALSKLSPSDLRPLYRAAHAIPDLTAREHALALWDKLVDRYGRALLPERQAGKRLTWKAVARSDMFPHLRCYRSGEGQLAQAATVDVEQQQELRELAPGTMEALLRRNNLNCRSPKVAREAVRFFVVLRHQPFGAEKVRLSLRRRGRRARQVTARYERSLPWSNESAEGAVRTRTETHQLVVTIDRKCRFRLRRDRVTKVVYSAP